MPTRATLALSFLVSACAARGAEAPPAGVPDSGARAPVAASRVGVPAGDVAAERDAGVAAPPPPVRRSFAAPSCDGGEGAGFDCQGGDCCARAAVPGGRFAYHPKHGTDAVETEVKPFVLDKYEATVGRFEAWLRAGAPTPKEGTTVQLRSDGEPFVWTLGATLQTQRNRARLTGWHRYDTFAAGQKRSPKNNINFYTAMAFCHFDGGRLPTDVEYQYAAAGGDENRRHPWGGVAPTAEHAVFNCNGDGHPSCKVQDLIAVGSRPEGAGRWGHMDLAGSVFEWTMAPNFNVERGRSNGGGFCYIGGDDHRAPRGLGGDTARYDSLETVSHMVGVRCAYDAPAGDGV